MGIRFLGMNEQDNGQETEERSEKGANKGLEEDDSGVIPPDVEPETGSQKDHDDHKSADAEEKSGEQPDESLDQEAHDTSGQEDDSGSSEEPVLEDEEQLLLTFLSLIQENNRNLEITGFQIKDFFEQLFPEKDVDAAYSVLKQQEFVRDRRDTKPFKVTWDGREQAEEYEEKYNDEIFGQVVPLVKERLEDEELLRRLLWLAYQDNYEFREYLPNVRSNLDEVDQFLTVFFSSDQFLAHQSVERLLRKIRTDERAQVQEKLESFCQDPGFLKAVAALRPKTLQQLLDIEADESTHASLKTALAAWIGEDDVGDVLGRLYLLGISESQNNFNADLEAVIADHQDELSEWLQFDRDGLRARAEDEWNVLLDVRRVAACRSAVNTDMLVEYGAVIPTKDGFLIRDEVTQLWEELADTLRGEVEERVTGIDNAVAVPFFSSGVVDEVEADIIVTLHARRTWSNNYTYPPFVGGSSDNRHDPERNLLTEKIIFVVSPSEVGFVDDEYQSRGKSSLVESPETNKEYNAFGEVPGLADVKAAFTECSWKVFENSTVEAAQEIREQQQIPTISLDEAFEEVAALEPAYQEALYLAVDKHSSKTAVERNHFTEDMMWKDVRRNLSARYPDFDDEDFDDIRETLKHIVEEKAETDLLTFRDTERVYNEFEEVLVSQIMSQVNRLDTAEQRALFLFLEQPPGYARVDRERYQRKIQTLYRLHFGEDFEGSLPSLVRSVGVVSKGTWISSQGNRNPGSYSFLEGLEAIRDKVCTELAIEVTEPDLTEFKYQFEDDHAELAGVEYLLREDGLAERDAMRDALLALSRTAWMDFTAFEGVISLKTEDEILLNPVVEDELHEWVIAEKQSLLNEREDIRQQLQAADIIDYRVSFDDEHGVYTGQVMTPAKETIQVVITPWFLPDDTSLLGAKNIVVITERHSSEIEEHLRDLSYEEILLITFEDDQFDAYSNLPDESFVESVVASLREQNELASRELETPVNEAEAAVEAQEDDESQSEDSQAVAASVSAGEGETAEGVRLFDELFETNDGLFPADVSRDRPAVVLLHNPANDRYGATVQVLCRELYHELKGGLPTGIIRSDSRDIQRDLGAEGRIEFIDGERDEFFKGSVDRGTIGIDDVQWSALSRRLQELFSQKIGFIIFQPPTELVSAFRSKLEEEVSPHQPQIIELKPQLSDVVWDIENDEMRSMSEEKQQLANGLWGYPFQEGYSESDVFDELFMLCEEEFWEELTRLKARPLSDGECERSVSQVVHRSPQVEDHKTENESELHFGLKAFVTRVLIETEKYGFDSVATEEDTAFARETNQKLIPDVQVGNTVYEVETLYGSGEPPNRINETVKKYKKRNKKPVINLVLTPLDAFMRYEELKRLQQGIEEDWEMAVNFKIPVLRERRLGDIDELVDLIPRL